MRAFLIAVMFVCPVSVLGQFNPKPKSYRLHSVGLLAVRNESVKDPVFSRYYFNQQGNIQFAAPLQTYWPVSRLTSSRAFWLGSTSVQSFGNGKMNTVYYFDMLGNLSNSRNLIDIKKNGKRRFQLNLSSR